MILTYKTNKLERNWIGRNDEFTKKKLRGGKGGGVEFNGVLTTECWYTLFLLSQICNLYHIIHANLFQGTKPLTIIHEKKKKLP